MTYFCSFYWKWPQIVLKSFVFTFFSAFNVTGFEMNSEFKFELALLLPYFVHILWICPPTPISPLRAVQYSKRGVFVALKWWERTRAISISHCIWEGMGAWANESTSQAKIRTHPLSLKRQMPQTKMRTHSRSLKRQMPQTKIRTHSLSLKRQMPQAKIRTLSLSLKRQMPQAKIRTHSLSLKKQMLNSLRAPRCRASLCSSVAPIRPLKWFTKHLKGKLDVL